ncbi:MAG: hypothetical protein SOI38_02605 [Eggerthellaceae bacterium]|jgi:hypothetical protein
MTAYAKHPASDRAFAGTAAACAFEATYAVSYFDLYSYRYV